MKCQQCGKEFEVPYPSLAKKRQFCSRTCASTARRGAGNPSWKGGTSGTITRVCENCGREYEGRRRHESKYCSRKCAAAVNLTTPEKHPRWKGGGVTRVCQQCGQEFKVRRCFVEKGGGLYCSRECSTKAFSANHRETFVCETCGKKVEAAVSKAKTRRYCSRECYQRARKAKVGGLPVVAP